MTIRITCPNGHRLRTSDEHAGRKGFCPHCKSEIRVPQLVGYQISDTSIVNLMESEEREPLAPHRPRHETSSATRECPKCRTVMPAVRRICPACQLYLPLLEE